MEYPKYKYHKEKEPVIVEHEKEEKSLGKEWADSPAEFGIETCPGIKPDEKILSKKAK